MGSPRSIIENLDSLETSNRTNNMVQARNRILQQTGLDVDLNDLILKDTQRDLSFEDFCIDIRKNGIEGVSKHYQVRELDYNTYSVLLVNKQNSQTLLYHIRFTLDPEENDYNTYVYVSEEMAKYKLTDGTHIWLSEVWTGDPESGDEVGISEWSVME